MEGLKKCKMCGKCVPACPQNAIDLIEGPSKKKAAAPKKDAKQEACDSCGVCK